MRLDKYLALKFPDKTRSQITNAIKSGIITVNGQKVKAGFELRDTDSIQGEIKNPSTQAEPESIKLDIVYQDDYLMIINKPRGMVVHPGAGVKSGTVLNALLGMGNTGLERAGIVHRLDKNTAGLMIVAKTDKAMELLGRMFEKHEINRTYIGLVHGRLISDMKIEKNIIRHPNHRTIFTTTQKGGRRAVTFIKVLECYDKYTLCQFNLETGRTHQIRVHCKSINHAIVGDPEYSSGDGQMLEAIKLDFLHPITAESISIAIQPTKEFALMQNKCYNSK